LETKRKTKAKSFTATLELTNDGLMWTIVRIPLDVEKIWGKRGQLRVKGEIASALKGASSFAFRATLFPTGTGRHFMIVNKKLQAGAKVRAGMQASFRIEPDTTVRKMESSPELERVLKQSRALRRFHDALSASHRREIARWIGQAKSEETRRRRAEQLAERMLETMEAERELPPMIARALEANPKARAGWEKMTQRQRRMQLMGIFYYRNPGSRARRLSKAMQLMLESAGGQSRGPGQEAEEASH
jgi:uncharacterized protein YdeI (YjbR/CyaY-like superfamily)